LKDANARGGQVISIEVSGNIPTAKGTRQHRGQDPSREDGTAITRSSAQLALERAAQRLARSAKRRQVIALGRGEEGELCWLTGPEVHTSPTEELFSALSELGRASDLGGPGQPQALRSFAQETGFSAAVSAGRRDEEGAILLLRDPRDPPGRVRPRTLAALQAAAEKHQGTSGAKLAPAPPMDRDLQRLDRLASLGDLVAEIVHEVRNPLVALKTFLRMLPDRLDDREFVTSFLDVADEEVHRIERLLNAVLNYARPAAVHPEASADLRDAFRMVEFLLIYRASERSVHFEVQQELPPLIARISPDALRQVILNLTMNAIDATPQSGTVRLSAEADAKGVSFSVADEGPGIPEEFRERVFEPFFSTKDDRPGGLGLGISRNLIEEAGGTLSVSDRPGGGSIFRAFLPGAD